MAPAPLPPVAGEAPSQTFGDELFRHKQRVERVSFGPGWILAEGPSGELVRWSFPEGERLDTLAPCDYPDAAGVSSDGSQLVVACDDEIRVVDRTSGAVQQRFQGYAERVAFGSNGVILARNYSALRWIDPTSGRVLQRLSSSGGGRVDEHDGLWLVPGVVREGSEGEFELVLVEPGKPERWRFPFGEQAVFTHDGSAVIALTPDELVQLDSATGKVQFRRPLDEFWYAGLAASRDGVWALGESVIHILDDRLEARKTLTADVETLIPSPDGAFLVAMGRARLAVFRADGTRLPQSGLGRPATAIAVSSDGQRIAATDGELVTLVDRANDQLHTVPVGSGLDKIALSPDGTKVAVGAYQGLWLLDASAAEARVVLSGQFLQFFAFDPTGTLWVIVQDEEIELLRIDPASVTITRRLTLAERVEAIASRISADGQSLVLTSSDGRLHVVSLDEPD